MSNDIGSIITLVGLLGWVSAMLVFIIKVFPGRDKFEARPARIWGLVVLISYAVWIAGMLNA
jgi:hypothetical protein